MLANALRLDANPCIATSIALKGCQRKKTHGYRIVDCAERAFSGISADGMEEGLYPAMAQLKRYMARVTAIPLTQVHWIGIA